VTGTRLARALGAEAIGTFALVFCGAGAIMVDAETGALGNVGVALTFGLVITVMIFAVGHVSGAHFNGAVTFESNTCTGALPGKLLRSYDMID